MQFYASCDQKKFRDYENEKYLPGSITQNSHKKCPEEAATLRKEVLRLTWAAQ